MKTRWFLPMGTGLVSVLALAAGAVAEEAPAAPAQNAVTTASAATEDASADAVSLAEDAGADSDAADADAGPPLPRFDKEPIAEERTPPPKASDWDAAPRVALTRMRHELSAFSSCEARRVREWIRVHCSVSTGSLALIGGEREGISLRLDPLKDEWSTIPDGAEIIFPVRRGDKRVFEWLQVAFGYKGSTSLEPFAVITESWLADDPGPVLLMD